MDFVCLAAGQGSRLGRLGTYLQKCMYPVGLKPFLEHTLEQLVACRADQVGDDRLTLVVGHLAHQVQAYFGDRFMGLPISYLEQAERNGTGHALALAHRALRPRASVVAWQADMFVTKQMFSAIIEHPDDNVVTLGPGHEQEPAVLRATVDGARVTRVWNGAGPLLDIGLWRLEPSVLAGIGRLRAPTGEIRMLVNLQHAIDEGTRVGYLECGEWIHLGGTLPTPEENVNAVVARMVDRTAGPNVGW